MEIPSFIETAIRHGISVIITYDRYGDNGFMFDMQTGAKSHLIIQRDWNMVKGCHEWVGYMRYGITTVIRDFRDLVWAVKRCDKNGYMSSEWQDLFNECDKGLIPEYE